jgi:hypothetical protein
VINVTAVDAAATLTTVGSIGANGNTGNVTQATVTSTAISGTGTPGSYSNPTTVNNYSNGFDSYTSGGNTGMLASTVDTVTANTYSYMTFGEWSCATSDGCNVNGGAVQVGSFVYGQETPYASIPATGTATYTGSTNGVYIDTSNAIFTTKAALSIGVDFAARTSTFNTTNTVMTALANNAQSTNLGLNMTGSGTYGSSNLIQYNLTSANGALAGASGRFYGPTAQEIGGVYSGGSSSTGYYSGSFVAK